MSEVHLGVLAPTDAERDATHVAVAPMVAAIDLRPGEHCGIYADGTSGPSENNIGIVDPFLTKSVAKGQKFFLCLYPRSVTGLRHQYLHPVLDGASDATSRDWIMKWADANDIGYDELIEHAGYWAESKSQRREYWIEGPRFEGTYLPEDFWDHYDRVMKKKTPEEKRQSFFSCSC